MSGLSKEMWQLCIIILPARWAYNEPPGLPIVGRRETLTSQQSAHNEDKQESELLSQPSGIVSPDKGNIRTTNNKGIYIGIHD